MALLVFKTKRLRLAAAVLFLLGFVLLVLLTSAHLCLQKDHAGRGCLAKVKAVKKVRKVFSTDCL